MARRRSSARGPAPAIEAPLYKELLPEFAKVAIQPFDEEQFGDIYIGLDLQGGDVKSQTADASLADEESVLPAGIQAAAAKAAAALAEGDYLAPTYASNERKRLESLWYYTKHMRDDVELHESCQYVSTLVKHFFGWEKIIVGLVDWNVFIPLLVDNCPFQSGPRRESMCSHTVMFDPRAVFQVPDAQNDGRFNTNPNIKTGIGAYAGTPIRVKTIDGKDDVAIGSLCVLSTTAMPALTEPQSAFLADSAELLAEMICERARAVRVEARAEMAELLRETQSAARADTVVAEVLTLVKRLLGEDAVVVDVLPKAAGISLGGGAKVVPCDEFVGGVWTDGEALDRILIDHATNIEPVRAIYADLDGETRLVVHTAEPRTIFDDLDVWLVRRCCAVVEVVRQREALSTALETKTRFMRGLGADLRWPLHSILSFTRMLQEDDALKKHFSSEATPGALLGNIEKSGTDLLDMIDDLLDVGQYDSADFRPAFDHVPIDDIEADLVHKFDTVRRDKQMRFVSDNRLPADIQLIYTDRALLVKCASFLLENAFKFSEPGTAVTLSFAAATDLSALEIDVLDHGIGIPIDERTRIFDVFEKSTLLSDGSGIGLSVATSLARKLGASLRLVHSEQCTGTCFRLTVPNPIVACRPRSKVGALTSYTIEGESTDAVDHALQRCGLVRRDADRSNGAHLHVEVQPDRVVLSRTDDPATGHNLSQPITCKSLATMLHAIEQGHAPRSNRPPSAHSSLRVEHDRRLSESAVAGPLAAAATARGTKTHLATILPAFERLTHPPRVLLADDNPTNLRIVELYCKKRKLQYVSVVDGQQAVDAYAAHLARNERFELLLLDNQMPRLSGVEAIERIREIERSDPLLSDNPSAIYIISGISLPQDIDKAAEAGCDGYFPKPLRLAHLDETILERFS